MRTMTVVANPAVTSRPRIDPVVAYAAALQGASCRVVGPGNVASLPISRWQSGPDEGDEQILRRCTGATVDIGCGPGRLTHALLSRGISAMGIDVVPEAVRQTRERGAIALRRDVFDVLPCEGRWQTALLADGNIGIGGDPVRLLRRVNQLLSVGGRVVADVAPPGGHISIEILRLEVAGTLSRPFRWAVVPADQVALLAEAAALRVLELVQHDGRWFAQLVRDA
jgi:SAM-dependent methyltransferase